MMLVSNVLALNLGLLCSWSHSTSFFCLNCCFPNSPSLSVGKPGKYHISFGIYASTIFIRECSHYSFLLSQHPLIPPYGTPVPYPAIYPPGSVYAHPSMATVSHLLTLFPLPFNPWARKCEFSVIFTYTR